MEGRHLVGGRLDYRHSRRDRKCAEGSPAHDQGRFLALLLLLVVPPALAQTFPPLTGRVVDQADLLTPEQEADLTGKLEALERASSRQLVVATVADLEGYPIEDYGYRLGRHWGIGQARPITASS